jgi:hypothetical protein
MTKRIYRGYDIEETEGGWVVSLNGVRRAKAASLQSAMTFVDIEKHKLRGAA